MTDEFFSRAGYPDRGNEPPTPTVSDVDEEWDVASWLADFADTLDIEDDD